MALKTSANWSSKCYLGNTFSSTEGNFCGKISTYCLLIGVARKVPQFFFLEIHTSSKVFESVSMEFPRVSGASGELQGTFIKVQGVSVDFRNTSGLFPGVSKEGPEGLRKVYGGFRGIYNKFLGVSGFEALQCVLGSFEGFRGVREVFKGP